MALSFSEKRGHQKVVDENLSTLEGGGLAFAAKRTAQKAMNDSLDKLNAGSELVPDPGNPNPFDEVKPPEPEVEPEVAPDPEPITPQNQKLTDLLSGKYDGLQPEAYLKVVQDIITEINDVEPVKPAVVSYLDKAKAKGLITEAAAAAIEELLNQ